MMQYVGRYFVRYINRSYRRSGTLWEGRFKASLVDSETYFLRCCRYIECNPVRAGMVLASLVWAAEHTGIEQILTIDSDFTIFRLANSRRLQVLP
jgi:putative transposase